jgi:hypothetical protein
MIIKHFIKLTIVILSMWIAHANAAYKPPLSLGVNKENYVVNADGTFVNTTESRWKVETQKGVDDFSTDNISYTMGNEEVEVLEAYTLQPNGQKIKVSKEAIKTSDDGVNNGTTEFNETNYKTIIYPNVKIGSVLYYKSITKQHTPTFKGHFVFSQHFSPHFKYDQQTITFEVSDKLPLKFATKGVRGGLVKTANHKKYYVFTFKQDTASPMESEEVDTYDFSPYIIASSFKDYTDFGNAYEEGAADKVEVTKEIKALANKLTLGMTDEKAQAEVLYRWVSQNIRYVQIYLVDGGFVPHRASDILKKQYGDCKDHTVLLAALLKAKGIFSSPALINLGDSYALPKFAISSPFNHVINYIPSLDIYLDSTSQFAPYGTLPFEVMDKPVLLTALGKLGRTPTAKPHENTITSNSVIRIKADGSMVGTANSTATGYLDYDFRNIANSEEGSDDVDHVTARLRARGETGTGKITVSKPTDLKTPFVENARFELDPTSNFPGPGAMRIPAGIVLANIQGLVKDKPIANVKYPSMCYAKTVFENYTLKFPSNTKITRIPSDVNYQEGSFKYQVTYQLNKDELKVKRMYESNHKSSVCGPNFSESRMAFFKVLQRDLRSQIFYD